MSELTGRLLEIIEKELRSFNAVLKTDAFNDDQRVKMLGILADGVCVLCGRVTDEFICHCENDE